MCCEVGCCSPRARAHSSSLRNALTNFLLSLILCAISLFFFCFVLFSNSQFHFSQLRAFVVVVGFCICSPLILFGTYFALVISILHHSVLCPGVYFMSLTQTLPSLPSVSFIAHRTAPHHNTPALARCCLQYALVQQLSVDGTKCSAIHFNGLQCHNQLTIHFKCFRQCTLHTLICCRNPDQFICATMPRLHRVILR